MRTPGLACALSLKAPREVVHLRHRPWAVPAFLCEGPEGQAILFKGVPSVHASHGSPGLQGVFALDPSHDAGGSALTVAPRNVALCILSRFSRQCRHRVARRATRCVGSEGFLSLRWQVVKRFPLPSASPPASTCTPNTPATWGPLGWDQPPKSAPTLNQTYLVRLPQNHPVDKNSGLGVGEPFLLATGCTHGLG